MQARLPNRMLYINTRSLFFGSRKLKRSRDSRALQGSDTIGPVKNWVKGVVLSWSTHQPLSSSIRSRSSVVC